MKRQPLRGGPLQREIINLAHLHHWRVAHFTAVQDIRGVWRTPAKADGKGFPDLVLVRERLMMVEIKGDGDSLSAEQEEWLAALEKAGIETHVWRPEHWRDGTVDLSLK